MSVCPKCKREYAPGRKICPADGAPLSGPSDSGVANTMPGGLAAVDTTPSAALDVTVTPEQRPTVAGSSEQTLPPRGAPPPITAPAGGRRHRGGPLAPGDMVDEYQITGKIGEGGMGAVYSGVQPVIGKKVAVKLLQAAVASNPEVVNRFVQEARAVNQIHSRHIVDIFSFGNLDDGQPYFVMEHIEGEPLRQYIKRRGALLFDEAHALLQGITRGLGAAHAAGIFHRDLKPENIIVVEEEDGRPAAKILDFGIAKLTGDASQPGLETATGMALGTPYYMSPEQARGANVDHRTDIYALGVIMFEMFTGALPFAAKSYIDLVNLHIYQPPPRPREVSDDVPAELEALILRCLEKEPGERPQSMEGVREELAAMAGRLSGAKFSVTASRAGVSAPSRGVVPIRPVNTVERAGRGHGKLLVMGVLALLAVVAGAAYHLASQKEPPGSPGRSAVARLAEVVDLTVKTRPSGATIVVDGAEVGGRTPLTIQLSTGGHELTVRLAGHVPLVRRVQLVAGVEKNVDYHLMPLARPSVADAGSDKVPTVGKAALIVSTGLARASYRLDGRQVGRGARIKLADLAAGAHQLSVRAPGRAALQRQITLEPKQTLRLELRLKRRPATTGVRSKPTKQGTDDPDRTLDPFKKKR